MKIWLLLFLGAGMLFFAAGSVALSNAPVENKGAAEIKLPGGTKGLVLFPHHRHKNPEKRKARSQRKSARRSRAGKICYSD